MPIRPASGVAVRLERAVEASGWEPVGSGVTDADGRARELLSSPPESGRYRLVFDTAAYFSALGEKAFYPEVSVTFAVDGEDHYHVPLLLNQYGYSTYRGS